MSGTCTMCADAPATTVWGFPVCDSCADWLTRIDGILKAEEADNPELAALRRRIDDLITEGEG